MEHPLATVHENKCGGTRSIFDVNFFKKFRKVCPSDLIVWLYILNTVFQLCTPEYLHCFLIFAHRCRFFDGVVFLEGPIFKSFAASRSFPPGLNFCC